MEPPPLFGSSKPVSEQDLLQAQACLRLLKQKMQREPPPYFREEVERAAAVYRKSFKPEAVSEPAPPTRQPMKQPVNNAKESSKGFSQYDFEGMTGAEGEPTATESCPDCGRSFKPESLEKHIKVCKKVFSKKRKQFDSAGQRDAAEADKPKKSAAWKQKSQSFRANLQAARLAEAGNPEAAKQAAEIAQANSGLVPCKFCGRTFNEQAAQRHIPICEKKAREGQAKKGAPARKK